MLAINGITYPDVSERAPVPDVNVRPVGVEVMIPREEVATCRNGFVPLPRRTKFVAHEVEPVPPLATGSVPVNVMFGLVPPLDAMLPEPVTFKTGVDVALTLPKESVARNDFVFPAR